jgi:hypothetical protein
MTSIPTAMDDNQWPDVPYDVDLKGLYENIKLSAEEAAKTLNNIYKDDHLESNHDRMVSEATTYFKSVLDKELHPVRPEETKGQGYVSPVRRSLASASARTLESTPPVASAANSGDMLDSEQETIPHSETLLAVVQDRRTNKSADCTVALHHGTEFRIRKNVAMHDFNVSSSDRQVRLCWGPLCGKNAFSQFEIVPDMEFDLQIPTAAWDAQEGLVNELGGDTTPKPRNVRGSKWRWLNKLTGSFRPSNQ